MRSILPYSKSLFTSTTFWSVVLLLCQAVGPHVDSALTRGNFTPTDVWAIFQACVTALVGVIARYNVGDMHTPKGLPGADPPTRPRGVVRQQQHVQDDLVHGTDNGVSGPPRRTSEAGEYRYSSYTVHDTPSGDVPLRRIPRLLTDDDSV